MSAVPHDVGTDDSIPSRVRFGFDRVSRTIFTASSMICMLALAYMLGSRARHLRLNRISRMNCVRKIVVLMYIFGMMFIGASAILQNGFGLLTSSDCYGAAIVCLIFYIGSKVLLYLFLVERAHVIRAPYKRRMSDKLWIFSMALVCLGFGAIATVSFVWPLSEISPVDGKCRIGLPRKVTIPMLTYDIAINIGFTVLFVYLLWPLLSFHRKRSRRNYWPRSLLQRGQRQPDIEIRENDQIRVDVGNQRLRRVLRRLVFKTVIGGFLIMIPTAANLTLLFEMKGHEPGWLCFTVCFLDVTWAIIIVHWLTVDPADLDSSIDNSGSSAGPKHMRLTTSSELTSYSRNGERSMGGSARRCSFLAIPGTSPLGKCSTAVTTSDVSMSEAESDTPLRAVRKTTIISQSFLHQGMAEGEACGTPDAIGPDARRATEAA
ncbi:uncharacterized protein LTHEOB_6686 [Lasiodiplodia theobromae]|nr:uncharacterized protein LTHEOB_6686 [Lasiodiplodia theobromae]KAF4544020.1 hypothetical protein LTHEOB_6686 [Lasiodiplodia theobromae]